MSKNNGSIVSMFSGCGGLDLGFKQAGFDIEYASDYADFLKETYDSNHEVELRIEDIREIDHDSIPDCDGIVGGPPCQSWSLAGNLAGTEDERGEVFYNYIELIENKQPNFFVAENVPGIISKANIDEFEEIIEKFEDIGYNVKYKKMNSAYYNVPQSRKRVIIVGTHKSIDYEYEFPSGSDEPTVQEDFLRNMGSSKSTDGDAYEEDELEMPNHEHYVGGFSSRYMSRNRVRNWDEPAYTVQANARHQKLHPQAPKMVNISKDNWKFKSGFEDLYRRYSVREAARIQTFPDEFDFHYDKIRNGYKMIGNAVPVNLAKAVAGSLDKSKICGDLDANKINNEDNTEVSESEKGPSQMKLTDVSDKS